LHLFSFYYFRRLSVKSFSRPGCFDPTAARRYHCRERFQLLPRQDGGRNVKIKGWAFYVSDDGQTWGQLVAEGTCPFTLDEQQVIFEPTSGRCVRLLARTGHEGHFPAIAELNLLGK
jgi:hypothetical protein